MSWFGYKLHLLVDTKYELPVGYTVTRAGRHDIKQMLPMIEEAKQKHFKKIETLNRHKKSGRDEEETKLLNPEMIDNLVYDYSGTVYNGL